MEQTQQGNISFDYRDLIRINRLIRFGIDFEAFKHWYDVLSVQEQSALVTVLCLFAYQAGITNSVYQDALRDANLEPNDPTVSRAELFHKRSGAPGLDLQGMYRWLTQLDEGLRSTVFRQFVYLFGKAEGERYRGCRSGNTCNHWWHRDLPTEEELSNLGPGHPLRREAWFVSA